VCSCLVQGACSREKVTMSVFLVVYEPFRSSIFSCVPSRSGYSVRKNARNLPKKKAKDPSLLFTADRYATPKTVRGKQKHVCPRRTGNSKNKGAEKVHRNTQQPKVTRWEKKDFSNAQSMRVSQGEKRAAQSGREDETEQQSRSLQISMAERGYMIKQDVLDRENRPG